MFRKSYQLIKLVVLLISMIKPAYSQSKYASIGGIGSVDILNASPIKPGKSAADSAWEALTEINNSRDAQLKLGKVQRRVLYERNNRKYYKEGLKFWQIFPDDTRRYEWLKRAAHTYAPNFWMDIDEGARELSSGMFYSSRIDVKQMEDWRKTMKGLRKVYLEDPRVGKRAKQEFLVEDLLTAIAIGRNISYQDYNTSFWLDFQRSFNQVVNSLNSRDDHSLLLQNANYLMFMGAGGYGIDLNELKNFLSNYQYSTNEKIREWAVSRKRLLDMTIFNFLLFDDAIAGKEIDVNCYKNKVLIIDFWSIYCSSCIKRMSVIRSMYEKYNKKGLEVISVSIDSDAQKDKVEKIRKKNGGNWKYIMVGEKDNEETVSDLAEWKKIWKQYGFQSIPQILLFDKEGELVAINGPLVFGDPEELLKKILAE